MVCRVCNTENAEDSIFCKHCGNKLDGKLICKNCETENDDDALFCKKCGKSLTAVTAHTVGIAGAQSGEIVLRRRDNSGIWKRVFEIVGWSFAMLGLFFSVLFTFLIGTRIKAGVDSYDLSSLFEDLGGVGHNIYYYFGDVYREIKDNTATRPDAYKGAELVPAIIGTVAAASVMLTVCILALVAIFRFVSYIRGNRKKDFAKLTVAAYLVFVLGSLVLLSVEHAWLSLNVSGITVSMGLALNSTTVAGISVGGACLLIFVLCRVILKGRELISVNNLVHLILSVICVTLLAVVLVYLPRAALGTSGDYDGYTLTGSLSIMQIMEAMIIPNLSRVAKEMAVAVAAQVVQTVLLTTVVILLVYQVCNICQERKNLSIIAAVPVLLLSIVYLVLCIEYANIVVKIGEVEDFTCISPIVSLVLSAVSLVLSIVQLFFRDKKQHTIESNL